MLQRELWNKLSKTFSLNPLSPGGREKENLSFGEGKGGYSIHLSAWPKWDENLVKDEEIKIAVQINGKVRTEILIEFDEEEESVKKKVLLNKMF